MKRSPRTAKKEQRSKKIIAKRRTCDPRGIGLSHYVFAEKKSR